MAGELGNADSIDADAAPVGDDVASAEPTDITDGRTLRRRRNRDAVIESLIGLINEGDLNPTIDKLAERAGVSARSIFRYFTDLNDLARTAVETEMRKVLPIGMIAEVGVGSFEERVERMVDARIRVISSTWRLLRVARSKSTAIPEIDRGLGVIADMFNDQFRRHFELELSQLDPAEAEELSLTLSMSLGFDVYDLKRRRFDRTDEEIANGWRVLLTRSLT